MRIISRYKDYYDYMSGAEPDNKKIYIRDNVTVNRSNDRVMIANDDTRNIYIGSSRYSVIKNCGKFIDHKYPRLGFIDNAEEIELSVLCVCDVAYQILEITTLSKSREFIHKFYIGEDIPMNYVYKAFDWTKSELKQILDPKYKYKSGIRKTLDNIKVPMPTNANKIYKAPIVILRGSKVELNPPLDRIGFGGIMSPEKLYIELYNWIPYNEPDTDSDPTNMNRYESKGFDKTTSFRNIK